MRSCRATTQLPENGQRECLEEWNPTAKRPARMASVFLEDPAGFADCMRTGPAYARVSRARMLR